MALYDCVASNPGEMSFKKDDIVCITQKPTDQGWWKGTLNGKVGYVPSSWFTVIDEPAKIKVEPKAAVPSINAKAETVSSIPKAKVLYDFQAKGSNELTVHSGEIVCVIDRDASTDWWEVEHGGRRGYVPKLFVELIRTPTVKKGRVLYDFVTSFPGELSVNIGDVITLDNQPTQGGWIKAEKNGKSGLVPMNYIEVLDS
jgi:NCK adaptor protein